MCRIGTADLDYAIVMEMILARPKITIGDEWDEKPELGELLIRMRFNQITI